MSFLVKKLPSWVKEAAMIISGFSALSLGLLIMLSEYIDWMDVLMSPFMATGYSFTIYFFIILLKIIIEAILSFALFTSISNIIRGTNGF